MTREERAIEESIRTGRPVDLRDSQTDSDALSRHAKWEDEESEYGGYHDRQYETYSGIRDGVPWKIRVRVC